MNKILIISLLLSGLFGKTIFSPIEIPIEGELKNLAIKDWNGNGTKDLLIQTDSLWYLYFQTAKGWNTEKADIAYSPPHNAIVYDFGNMDDHPDLELVYFTTDGIFSEKITNPDPSPKLLLKTSTIIDYFFSPDEKNERKFTGIHYSFLQSINQDEKLSLFVPTMNGIDIFNRKNNSYVLSDSLVGVGERSIGTFAKKIEGRYTFDAYRLMNFKQDEYKDILFKYDDHISIFSQDASLSFSEKRDISLPASFTTDIRNERSPELNTVKDINQDGIPDIVASKLVSQSLLSVRTHIQSYLGQQKNEKNNLTFSESPDHVAVVEGVAPKVFHADINLDGKQELIILHFELGLIQIIRALTTSNLSFDLSIYAINPSGIYDKYPSRKISLSVVFNFTGRGNSASGSSMMNWEHDFNGDGLADFIVMSGSDEVTIRFGDKTNFIHDSDEVEYDSELLEKSFEAKYADLNGDKKSEIIFMIPDEGKIVIWRNQL